MIGKKIEVVLSFDNPEEIKKFIAKTESGLYSGKNVDGQEILISLDKGKGMLVETLNSKGWWEWNDYDECGFVIAQGVNPSAEIEKKLEEKRKQHDE